MWIQNKRDVVPEPVDPGKGVEATCTNLADDAKYLLPVAVPDFSAAWGFTISIPW